MASEIQLLTEAIVTLTDQLKGGGKSSSSASSGVTQGITEADVTAAMMNHVVGIEKAMKALMDGIAGDMERIASEMTAVFSLAVGDISNTLARCATGFEKIFAKFNDDLNATLSNKVHQHAAKVGDRWLGVAKNNVDNASQQKTVKGVLDQLNATKDETHARKETTSGLGAMASKMKAFGMSMVNKGVVLKGLHDTIEGFQLNYASNHFAYELADLLRGPIRFIINELEGLARVMHAVSHSQLGKPAGWGVAGWGVAGAMAGGMIAGGMGAVVGGAAGILVGVTVGPLSDAIENTARMKADNIYNKEKLYSKRYEMAERGIQEHNPVKYERGMASMHKGWADAEAVHQKAKSLKWAWDTRDMPSRAEQLQANKDKAQYELGIHQLERLKRNVDANPQANPAHKIPAKQNFDATTSSGKKKEDEHIQPIQHAQFMGVEDLQNRMIQMTLENPAQEKGLSLIETIAKAIVKMAYGEAESNKLFPDDPIRRDTN